jgi:hypothetical protein
MAKKKTIRVGIIRKEELLKNSRPRQDIPFKTGYYMAEQDRPRKKFHSEDFTYDDLKDDYLDDDFDDDVDLEP